MSDKYGGDLEVVYTTGMAYMTGDGRPLDYKEGLKYLQQAAEKGFVPAMRDLAVAYLNGLGTPPSAEKAYPLMKQASDALDPNAMYHLALMYETGAGVERDLYEALRLMAYSAGMNFTGAADEADRIEGEIDAERKRKLDSRPLLKLEISDVDIEAACCKRMLDAAIAKEVYVDETYMGPMLMTEDDKGEEIAITECPFCKAKAVRVRRDKRY